MLTDILKIIIAQFGLHRDFLLKVMPKNSVCAEIGVYKGDFSKKILDVLNPQKLHLIDPWRYESAEIYKESLYGGRSGSQVAMDKIFEDVKKRFEPDIIAGRVVLHRKSSHEASLDFPDNYFDWIYIDANHQYEFVKKDMEMYFNKIKKGGFIAGDDYADGGWWQGGVKKAVDELIGSGTVEKIIIKNRQFILQKI